jgi:hypothetical protein
LATWFGATVVDTEGTRFLITHGKVVFDEVMRQHGVDYVHFDAAEAAKKSPALKALNGGATTAEKPSAKAGAASGQTASASNPTASSSTSTPSSSKAATGVIALLSKAGAICMRHCCFQLGLKTTKGNPISD